MNIATRRNAWAGEDGQALIEFALLLPVLFLVLAGIIELGRAWNIKLAVTDAAREGARYAVLADHAPQGEVEDTIRKRLSLAGIKNSNIDWGPDGFPSSPATAVTTQLTVLTDYKMPWIGSLLNWGGTGTISIGSTTVMRNEETVP